MAGRKDIHKDGVNTQFGKGNDPTQGGRKKKIYTILKEKGFGKDDIRTCFGEIAFYTTQELQEIREDDSKPAIMKVVAGAFLNAIAEGDFREVKDLLEQVVGKPEQSSKMDLTSNGKDIDPSKFITHMRPPKDDEIDESK